MGKESLLFCVFVGILFYILDKYLFDLSFGPKWEHWQKLNPNKISYGQVGGALRRGRQKEIRSLMISLIIIGPSIEEAIYRGPLLLAAHYFGPLAALLTAIPLSVLFGWSHKLDEKIGISANGPLPDFMYWHLCVSGFLYSLSVIITGSILPAIIAHSMHNALVTKLIHEEIKKMDHRRYDPELLSEIN